jgi:1-acyl-sn-glycerol-3-phosphate acyltransferase
VFYWFGRFICRVVLLLRRMKVYGGANVPRQGGLLVVSNHVSYWDPVVVGSALTRKVHFMAKTELFAIPVFGTIIKWCEAFPVNRRGTDQKAVRAALQFLRQGEVVGIFPEGTRSHTAEFLDPYLGAAMLAVHGNAAVLPVAVIGTRGFLGKVEVVIGRPLNFPKPQTKSDLKEKYRVISLKIMDEISQLRGCKER